MRRINQPPANAPSTLMQAHDLLISERPRIDAPPAVWERYYRRSAALYAQIAEIDRGHHHEALYWSSREREKANEIARRVGTSSADDPD